MNSAITIYPFVALANKNNDYNIIYSLDPYICHEKGFAIYYSHCFDVTIGFVVLTSHLKPLCTILKGL